MNNNGRPLTMRKKVQLLLALTILAWATQTLFAQWSRGQEVAFVPRVNGPVAFRTLELRGKARVVGGEVVPSLHFPCNSQPGTVAVEEARVYTRDGIQRVSNWIGVMEAAG